MAIIRFKMNVENNVPYKPKNNRKEIMTMHKS